MAIEVVELDGHRVAVFVAAYGSPDASASASGPVAGGLPSAGLRAVKYVVRQHREPCHDAAPLRSSCLCPNQPPSPLAWPNEARVALWVNPNVEFFGLDDVMPSNLNDRVPRDQAKIPNVR